MENPSDNDPRNRRLPLYFHVHLVSDSTGETLTNVMKASVAQFDQIIPIEHFYALVRSPRQMQRVLDAVADAPGVVFFTILDETLRRTLELRCAELGLPCVAVLDPMLATLSRYIGLPVQQRIGAQRALDDHYYHRIEALDFAMAHDDGQQLDSLHQADVVLVGVSRTSKTPTTMYLAHRGVRAANVPLVPGVPLPPQVQTLTAPLIVGLTATPDRLVTIRRNRLLGLRADRDTAYVDGRAVRDEVVQAKRLFKSKGWPMIDVTRRSVEETAAQIMNLLADHREQQGQ